MEFLAPKYRRDPNEMIDTIYHGVVPGGRTVTAIRRVSEDRNHMVTDKQYGPGIPAQQGGRVGVFIMGGLETTLDEMTDLLNERRNEPMQVQKQPWEVAKMCHDLMAKRNQIIEDQRKLQARNPSMRPRRLPTRPVLHLPSGFRMKETSEPGLKVLARV